MAHYGAIHTSWVGYEAIYGVFPLESDWQATQGGDGVILTILEPFIRSVSASRFHSQRNLQSEYCNM